MSSTYLGRPALTMRWEHLDRFDGDAWLGIVPFRMTRVRPLGIRLPRNAFSFDEVNVRTYVTAPDGTRGVWFLSLHGHDRAGAIAARAAFGVPYHYARVSAEVEGVEVAFASRRDGPAPAAFRARYRPTGPAVPAAEGSLEAFLTDRLALFAVRRGTLVRGDVSHAPWPLQPAEAEIELDTLSASHGIRLPGVAPVLQFTRRLDVAARWPVAVG